MNQFRILKAALGLSNGELAAHLGVGERTVRRYLAGTVQPKPSILRDLQALLAKRKLTRKGKI